MINFLQGLSEDDIDFRITDIELPENLRTSLTIPQEEELRRRGTEEQAKGRRILVEELQQAGVPSSLAALLTSYGAKAGVETEGKQMDPLGFIATILAYKLAQEEFKDKK